MAIDISGDLEAAITDSVLRGHPIVWAYLGDDGYASLSYRGSTIVYSPTQVAVWARKRDEGLAAVVAERPKVSGLYFEHDGPGPVLIAIKGLARVDESANDRVYSEMPEIERERDPDKAGVAVVIDVEEVNAFGATGAIQQTK